MVTTETPGWWAMLSRCPVDHSLKNQNGLQNVPEGAGSIRATEIMDRKEALVGKTTPL